jgi:ubiquinone/menaquinone biosynthesis C-methylase UbiE
VAESHPVFARVYRRLAASMERRGGDEHRRRLLAGLRGTVLEVGAGHGINFPYYPPEVGRLVAVEPEPHLREVAEEAALRVPAEVHVRAGRAERLPFDADAFDAVVVSLMLCSVEDQDAVLSEIVRVLRPGGHLRVYEHVRSSRAPLARVQRTVDVVWPYVAGGCRTSLDTRTRIERAGFVWEEIDEFRFPETRLPLPTSPHVLGHARLSHARPS